MSITRGKDPRHVVPVFASEDRALIGAVVRELARQLGVALDSTDPDATRVLSLLRDGGDGGGDA